MPLIMKINDEDACVFYKFSPCKDAVEIANKEDKKLTAYDFKPNEWVLLLHEEGTQFLFRNAFLKEWKDWVLVFTEHHKTHVYHKTDLTFYGNLKELPAEKLLGTGKIDICFECKKEFSVDNLSYEPHPAKHDSDFIVPLCKECYAKAEIEEDS